MTMNRSKATATTLCQKCLKRGKHSSTAGRHQSQHQRVDRSFQLRMHSIKAGSALRLQTI